MCLPAIVSLDAYAYGNCTQFNTTATCVAPCKMYDLAKYQDPSTNTTTQPGTNTTAPVDTNTTVPATGPVDTNTSAPVQGQGKCETTDTTDTTTMQVC